MLCDAQWSLLPPRKTDPQASIHPHDQSSCSLCAHIKYPSRPLLWVRPALLVVGAHRSENIPQRGPDPRVTKPSLFYSGRDLAAAFLEVFGDKIRHSRRLAAAVVERYDVYAVKCAANLKILELEATNLAKLGATLACFSGSYPLSQRWGAALMRHPDKIDGLVYLGRRSGAHCLALFGDRDTPKKHQTSLAPSRMGRLDELLEFWQLVDDLELAVF